MSCRFLLRGGSGGGAHLRVGTGGGASVKVSPVTAETMLRTVRDRHRMVRQTRAGRECQLSSKVPNAKITRRDVMIYKGGRERTTHTGVIKRMRMNSVVRAGLVVAEVAVCWVERKSVNCSKGSSRTLHREVKTVKVETISSRLF